MNTRKIRVALGKLIYACFAQFLPMSFAPVQMGQKAIRAFCGRLILTQCGSHVNIERRAVFSSKVQLGDRSGIGAYASISGTCIIGRYVMMGPHCTIYTQNHRTEDLTHTMAGQGFQEERPVVIGDDVWIGGHVIILPGVRIGSHCIIGAGSVVTKNVPDWAVAAGNPAVVKKYRNSTEGRSAADRA